MTDTDTITAPPSAKKLREQAELAKIQAETRKIDRDLALGDIYADEARAELRRKVAEAERAEAVAHQYKLVTAGEVRKENIRKTSDFNTRTYRFNSEVAGYSTEHCMETLNQFDKLDDTCDIKIFINSPGGSVVDGMALYDDIVALSLRGGGTHKITTVVRGYAASMGGILLQAGDHRVCGPESYLLIHEGSAMTWGSMGEIRDQVKWYAKINERVTNIFLERAGDKISRQDFETKYDRKDWWLDSTEALALGFVDEVA